MTPPKLPRRIQVLTRWYTLKYDRKLQKYGECDRVARTIRINPDTCETEDIILQTLWHEIAHAFAWEAGLCNILNPDAEEMFVENIASVIVHLTGGKLKIP